MRKKTSNIKHSWVRHRDSETHLLREIMRIHQALMSNFTREVGMPSARFALLRLLAISYPEKLGIMEIARRLGVDPAAITRQIKEMGNENFVSRISDPKDRRRNDVVLTAKGLQIFEQVHKCAHEFEGYLYKSITAEDLETTIRVLSDVRKAVEKS